jgi:anti-anti-sigma factor
MEPSLIECARQETRQWIRVSGRVTMVCAPGLRAAMETCREGVQAVWLDLSQATHMDSTVIGCLVAFSKKAASGGPSLVLNNPSVGCLNALRQLQLDKVLRTENQPVPGEGWLPATVPVPSREELARVVANAHEQLAAEVPDNPVLARIAKAFGKSATPAKDDP